MPKEGDWVLAYAKKGKDFEGGYIGAGIIKGENTYKFHQDHHWSLSNHQHERAVDWLYFVSDVHNAVRRDEANYKGRRPTCQKITNIELAERIIDMLKARSGQIPSSQNSSSTAKEKLPLFLNFTQAPIRREQASFREAVYLTCNGQCVISGCDIPVAVEAAHIIGRNWREGYNSKEDGILLRRDLHALYDNGLLTVSSDGIVELDTSVRNYYQQYHNIRITVIPNALKKL